MELPILKYLPLPEDARRIVIQFLRKPHPTAVLIKQLTFERFPNDGDMLAYWNAPIWPFGYSVRGDTIRRSDPYNPRVLRKIREFRFHLDEHTGEYPKKRWRTDQDDVE